jgi:integrase/recombinase XerD
MIIWRRHTPRCTSTDKSDPRCGCPIYQEFRVGKRRHRLTLKTRNWQKALAEIRRQEIEGVEKLKPKGISIGAATDKFIADAEARGLREPTIYKFKLLFNQLKAFADHNGYIYIGDLGVDNLRQFRATWPNKNESARVKLGNLKAFLNFCQESGWIGVNPAGKLKAAKISDPKIEPLTVEEFQKIIAQARKSKKNAERTTALILLMRFTGLRIRDAVTLRRDSIDNGRLFLRMAKTGLSVYCPLPPELLSALAQIKTDLYYFWSGHSKPKSAVGDYQRALRTVFKHAGVPRAYPHLFRHTFATQLLQDGVSLETVAMLLGHSSTRITAKHYSHWVRARQERLESEVKKSWAQLGTVADEVVQNA